MPIGQLSNWETSRTRWRPRSNTGEQQRQHQDKNELKKVEGAKAFIVSDPMQSMNELRELSQIDRNKDGVIDRV